MTHGSDVTSELKYMQQCCYLGLRIEAEVSEYLISGKKSSSSVGKAGDRSAAE